MVRYGVQWLIPGFGPNEVQRQLEEKGWNQSDAEKAWLAVDRWVADS